MMIPRNSAVLVTEVKREEQKVGAGVILPAKTNALFRICKIVAVGEGLVHFENMKPDTSDLKPGMFCVVKVNKSHRIDERMVGIEPLGYEFKTDDGEEMKMVDQLQIVGILPDMTDIAKIVI